MESSVRTPCVCACESVCVCEHVRVDECGGASVCVCVCARVRASRSSRRSGCLLAPQREQPSSAQMPRGNFPATIVLHTPQHDTSSYLPLQELVPVLRSHLSSKSSGKGEFRAFCFWYKRLSTNTKNTHELSKWLMYHGPRGTSRLRRINKE